MKAREFVEIVKETIMDTAQKITKYNYYLDYNEKDLDNNNILIEFLEEYIYDNNFLPTRAGDIQLEKSIGGTEGKGSYVQRVFSVYDEKTKEKEYFACEGYYSSWVGVEYDGYDFVKVKPQEEIVINYIPE